MNGPRLHLRLPDGTSQELVLASAVSVGRLPGNDLLLPDREVSKEHARIEPGEGGWFLRDLGSSNGSFVNGQRVTRVRLRHGDEISLGSSSLRFLLPEVSRVTIFPGAGDAAAILTALSRDEAAGFLPEHQIASPELLRRDYEKLRIALELGRLIVFERDEDALLERILAFAFEVLPAEHGVILLVDPATDELVPRAVRHRSGNDEELTLSGSILRRVRTTRESVLILDAGTDSRFSDSRSLLVQGIRSAMAVPLLQDEEVRGVLVLDSRRQVAAFSEKDLQLLSAISAQASLALERTSLARQIEQEAEARAHLSRFLSPALVEQARTGQLDLKKGGQLTHATVLFCDIRGFTALSETVGPEETVRMLNEYFERMVDCVFRHGGILDKFIGDALMALWGAPVQRPDDIDNALRCALEMRAQLEELNASRLATGRPPIAFGVGINAGPAVVGNMGSSKRLEYTAIGDAVNLASRLCDLAGPGEILISTEAPGEAANRFRVEPIPATRVKGKSQVLSLCRVYGTASTEGCSP